MTIDLETLSAVGVLLFFFHMVTAVLVLLEPKTWKWKLGWLLVVLSVPLVGPFYYWLFKGDYEKDGRNNEADK